MASQGGGTSSTRWPDISVPGMSRKEPTFADEMCDCCPSLTYTQRVIGFSICLALGYILSFVGSIILIGGQISAFAVLYVFGTCLALSATGFLVGPKRQCQKMFHKTRRISCIVYLVLLVTTFAVAVAGVNAAIVILLLLLQAVAATWYMLSYIPYARKFVISTCCGPCKESFDEYKEDGGA